MRRTSWTRPVAGKGFRKSLEYLLWAVMISSRICPETWVSSFDIITTASCIWWLPKVIKSPRPINPAARIEGYVVNRCHLMPLKSFVKSANKFRFHAMAKKNCLPMTWRSIRLHMHYRSLTLSGKDIDPWVMLASIASKDQLFSGREKIKAA